MYAAVQRLDDQKEKNREILLWLAETRSQEIAEQKHTVNVLKRAQTEEKGALTRQDSDSMDSASAFDEKLKRKKKTVTLAQDVDELAQRR